MKRRNSKESLSELHWDLSKVLNKFHLLFLDDWFDLGEEMKLLGIFTTGESLFSAAVTGMLGFPVSYMLAAAWNCLLPLPTFGGIDLPFCNEAIGTPYGMS